MRFFHFFLDLIFPPSPLAKRLRSMNVDEFLAAIPPARNIDMCHVLSQYKNPLVHEAIWQMKFRGDAHATQLLAAGMHRLIISKIALATGPERNIPVLIPVPASKRRIRERGFDQCRRLAEEIGKIDAATTKQKLKIEFDVLEKSSSAQEQKGLTRKDRLVNLEGTFLIRAAHADAIRAKDIVLIDDVHTTGATLHECSKVLISTGARSVLCCALAH